MKKKAPQEERPLIITIFCILGFIFTAISILIIFLSPSLKTTATFTLVYSVLIELVGLAGWIGVWFMKKWGAILYSTFFVVNQAALILIGSWNARSLLTLVPIAVMFSQFTKMD